MRLKNLNSLFDNQKMAIFVILVLSLVIRIGFVMTMDRGGFYFIDTSSYDKAATSLIKDGTFGIEYGRPPVYPVFLAGIYSFSYQNFLLVRIVQCLLGSLICILIFSVGRKLYGIKTAFLAGLISSIYPIFVFKSGLLYPTTLITLWLLLVVLFLLRAAEARPVINFPLAGLFMGLAILTKPVAIVFFILLVSYFLIKKDSIESKKILPIFLLILCNSAVTSIWVMRNYHVRGEISVIESNRRLEATLRGLYGDQKEKSLPISTRLNSILFRQGDRFLRHFASEVIHFWALYPDRVVSKNKSKRDLFKSRDRRLQADNPYVGNFTKYVSIVSFLPILIFGIIGFALSLRRGKKIFLLVSPILSFWFGYSIFFTQIRYRIPIEPFLIILAAFGLNVFMEWLFVYPNSPQRTPKNSNQY